MIFHPRKAFFLNFVVRLEEIRQAMVNVALKGYGKQVLECECIVAVGWK
jgi:hypothetical protein